jgi:hypothetical protein
MASSGISSGGIAPRPPSNDGSNSDNGGDDDGVPATSDGGSGPRRSGRQRTMSSAGAEAVASGVSFQQWAAAYEKHRPNNRSSAPSTITPGTVPQVIPLSSSSTPLPLSSLVPSAPAHVSSAATAAALQPLHGIGTARTAHAARRATSEVKGNNNSSVHVQAPPSAPSTDERSSGNRERSSRSSRHRHRHRDRDDHRSPSPSSSSSEDELVKGRHSLYYNGLRIKPRKQWHLSAIRTMRSRYASFTDLFEDANVSTVRNKYEGEELAAMMDQILIARDYINQPDVNMDHVKRARTAVDVALELSTRRLQGIIQADASGGDWSYASSLSLLKRANLGNDDLIRSVTLDVTRTRAATKANNNGSNGNGRGNGGNDSSHRGNRRGRGRGRGKPVDNNVKSSSNDTTPAK